MNATTCSSDASDKTGTKANERGHFPVTGKPQESSVLGI